jgi:hypothetical protein
MPKMPIDLTTEHVKLPSIQDFVTARKFVQQQVKQQLQESQARM